ncbi:primosomal protein N', partial [Patescibacteria group bacterium]
MTKLHKVVDVIPTAKVARTSDQVFTYLPLDDKDLKPGQLVQIPFGRQRLDGVIVGQKQQEIDVRKFKRISKIIDATAVLSPVQLKLARWIANHYVTSLGLVIKTMLPRRSVRPPKFSARKIAVEQPYELTTEQLAAMKIIRQGKNKVTLLHGITGSGKTEIYLQTIADCLQKNQQSIVLIPEISLTPQTIDRFTKRFGDDQIAVLHSRLPYGRRWREWQRIRSGQAKIVVGPRSALFAPVRNLGLIVIDEEHETSYKQWDKHPRYHAREVAVQYSELTGAKVILGSATPAIETYHQARSGKFNLAELNERINKAPLPHVEIVDMRNELRGGNKSIISESLQQQIKNTMAAKEQAILFINRRGAATFVMCRDCGHVIECPECSVSLTYHWQDKQDLRCHHCGHRENVPQTCPACKSQRIRYFGAGTQRVEAEINKLFPEARVLRMDTDTTKRTHAHTEIFRTFARHQADILVGTQMVTQGFDLPKVALVGIISADTSLNFPDFRAHERTFQLLTQVAGRTGRRDKDGLVILQTYHPKNDAILAAAKHNYSEFYQTEIAERRILGYPPFANFIKITI